MLLEKRKKEKGKKKGRCRDCDCSGGDYVCGSCVWEGKSRNERREEGSAVEGAATVAVATAVAVVVVFGKEKEGMRVTESK